MMDDEAAYQALTSRDARFDGVFFVGVTSTGIYCRPICPAKTPMRRNCNFYASAEAAEKASFRPCLRCRPELAPGNAPVDKAQRISHRILQVMEEGSLEDGNRLAELADRFGVSVRHLRRMVQAELGVSPIELIQTRRLLLAKQLLTETKLSIIEVAFASGFASLRRFNDAFAKHYLMAPGRLRKEAGERHPQASTDRSTLQLSYRPPYDWEGILEFLRLRSMKGVEWVEEDRYTRTVRIGDAMGWIRVSHAAEKHSLMMEFSHSLLPVLPALISRVRNLFDLMARPDLIADHLRKDPLLDEKVRNNPGLRVPGAFDPFEMAIRAVLGQQITVKAATTLAGRFAEAYGEPLITPFAPLNCLTPIPEVIAGVTAEEIGQLGIVNARARCIVALAEAFRGGVLNLTSSMDPESTIQTLESLPGIGPWTARYIAMRALRWPDAFPKEDIVIRNRLGGISAKQAEERSRAWSPWRSYAVLYLWRG